MDYHRQFFEECRLHTGELSEKSVLIAGCGTGLDCAPFAEAGSHVTGMDFCEEFGKACSHPNVRYHRGSIEGCDLPSNRFDVVYSVATMEHVGNIEAGFTEMVRLARPNGLIYSVASPLWNSRRGHHLDCLNEFPWIHLRVARAEILQLARERGLNHNGHPWDAVLEFLFDSDYFNRAPSSRYLAACRSLPVSKLIRNDLWFDGQEDLSGAILKELESKGRTRDELLATSHTFAARK